MLAGAMSMLAAGCAAAARPAPVPAPAPAAVTAPAVARRPTPLPPIPRVDGPLAIKVIYPAEGQSIAVRDSNFILGSLGNGGAQLRINGESVRVMPNGSFLAWLPLPPRASSSYVLDASTGTDSARFVRRIALAAPPRTYPTDGALVVDTSSVAPRGSRLVRADEWVRVSVRGPVNAVARVQLSDSRLLPLVDARAARGNGASGAEGTTFATDVMAAELRRAGHVLVVRGADTVRLPISEVSVTDTGAPQLVVLGAASPDVPDTDRVVIAKPVPNGTYKWFFLPGTVLEVTGKLGDQTRVKLDDRLEVWINASELRALPAGTPRPRRVASNARVFAATDWVDVVIPVGDRPAHEVREEGDALILTLFGTTSNSDIVNLPSTDSLVRDVSWRQVASDRAEYRVQLTRHPYGYLAMWNGSAFVLRVRRPPRVGDAARPLTGLTIAVNAGHPPAGSTGPTGVYEAVPTLEVSQRLARELEARGARVVMVRTTPDPMPLALRPVVARRANSHAFVSIHLNALPDGINPFTANGTGAYYFNPHSEPLARAVQLGMVASMGLRDLGINYDNLSDIRPTWMPMVLCEGAFLIMPEQEAAMRTTQFQDAYARGVADGLESYFRSFAAVR